MKNYPDGPRKVLGFLDYKAVLFLQLDHIYTSYYFIGMTLLLGASLIACTKTQQLPLVKMARRWQFPAKQETVFAKGNGAGPTPHAPSLLAQANPVSQSSRQQSGRRQHLQRTAAVAALPQRFCIDRFPGCR